MEINGAFGHNSRKNNCNHYRLVQEITSIVIPRQREQQIVSS